MSSSFEFARLPYDVQLLVLHHLAFPSPLSRPGQLSYLTAFPPLLKAVLVSHTFSSLLLPLIYRYPLISSPKQAGLLARSLLGEHGALLRSFVREIRVDDSTTDIPGGLFTIQHRAWDWFGPNPLSEQPINEVDDAQSHFGSPLRSLSKALCHCPSFRTLVCRSRGGQGDIWDSGVLVHAQPPRPGTTTLPAILSYRVTSWPQQETPKYTQSGRYAILFAEEAANGRMSPPSAAVKLNRGTLAPNDLIGVCSPPRLTSDLVSPPLTNRKSRGYPIKHLSLIDLQGLTSTSITQAVLSISDTLSFLHIENCEIHSEEGCSDTSFFLDGIVPQLRKLRQLDIAANLVSFALFSYLSQDRTSRRALQIRLKGLANDHSLNPTQLASLMCTEGCGPLYSLDISNVINWESDIALALEDAGNISGIPVIHAVIS